jgi:hypothetical protein
MKPFLAIWTGDREALVAANDRPGVWLPKEPGDNRWELHAPQGLPEPGQACVIASGVEHRFDGGPHGHTTRRVIQLYAPDEEPVPVPVRTEVRLLSDWEPEPLVGWSVFDHPDGSAADAGDFWRLFRIQLAEPVEAVLFTAPRRETAERPLYGRRSCPDPLRRYERMVDEETGKVLAR